MRKPLTVTQRLGEMRSRIKIPSEINDCQMLWVNRYVVVHLVLRPELVPGCMACIVPFRESPPYCCAMLPSLACTGAAPNCFPRSRQRDSQGPTGIHICSLASRHSVTLESRGVSLRTSRGGRQQGMCSSCVDRRRTTRRLHGGIPAPAHLVMLSCFYRLSTPRVQVAETLNLQERACRYRETP